MKEKEIPSIDWLIEKWNDYPLEIGKAQFRRYLYEAKEKEIINRKKAFMEGHSVCRNITDNTHEAEEIYNEKYGQ